MLERLLGSREDEITPHEGPVMPNEPRKPSTGGRSGAIRAAVFGINDGLVTNLSLVMFFTGATVDNKIIVLAGIIFFVRFTYPRFREDQLQRFAWIILIPISLLNITATAILKVVF